MLYAEIILPIPGPCYTFSIEGEDERAVMPGSVVEVQFGARKDVVGIVSMLSPEPPPYNKIKPISKVVYPGPLVPALQLRLWEWMADYYMCSLGDVMRAALPAMFKKGDFVPYKRKKSAVPNGQLFVAPPAPPPGGATRISAKSEKETTPATADNAALAAQHTAGCELPVSPRRPKKAQSKNVGYAALASSDVQTVARIVSDCPSNYRASASNFPLPILSAAQKTALKEVEKQFESKEVVLLFGVAASGKSEITFHAIAQTLARGRNVLMLLPEISLTTQFVKRVQSVFGDRVVLCHSGLSDRRRAEAYLNVLGSGTKLAEAERISALRGAELRADELQATRNTSGEFPENDTKGPYLIVGTRSAIFLPVNDLGLVVVDEEQDAGYKQQDPAPRYNARDTAIVMARAFNAKVILQSATPSLETWVNGTGGKYGLVRLEERYGDAPAPAVSLSDTLRSVVRGERKSHFNKPLLDQIGEALAAHQQVILFQNRRGMAAFVECPDCGWVPYCSKCGLPMIAHKKSLKCHCCGRTEYLPSVCPVCSSALTTRGFGTEKIEDELAVLFPSARIARLDGDCAISERAYNQLLDDFERGEVDILVGTQIVTKGLDFDGVSLVGILNADNLVNHPDFRASERAYQLINQVIGRAGRRDRQGSVVIQTARPDNRLLGQAAAGDYAGMASEMLAERAQYGYPPYSRLISITMRHGSRVVLDDAAAMFAGLLRPHFGDLLIGPQPPVNERVKGEFALVFLLKVPRGRALSEVREILRRTFREVNKTSPFRGVMFVPNVDPL